MNDLLTNVERDWMHVAGEDLYSLRKDLVHGRGK